MHLKTRNINTVHLINKATFWLDLKRDKWGTCERRACCNVAMILSEYSTACFEIHIRRLPASCRPHGSNIFSHLSEKRCIDSN
mmetsp:Transcript_8398/g.23389  ORF Transcript_8398/g.23389 Transcript_8398/m.23389 type:complete len:83 (-) Transcript_8398:343-591(-)